MAVQPISPQGALDLKITNIPDVVIQTVNNMLAEKMTRNPHIVLRQCDVIARIIAGGTGISKNELYANGWLDFEPFYEKAGWKVVYDKPAYCESYEPTFTFTKP